MKNFFYLCGYCGFAVKLREEKRPRITYMRGPIS
jgi:hypothetical protein